MPWHGRPSVVRPSVRRPQNAFSQKTNQSNKSQIFVGKYLSTTSPDHYPQNLPQLLWCFFKHFFPKYFLWQSSQKLFIGILKCQVSNLKKKRWKFSLTWNYMGVKISKRYFSCNSYNSFGTIFFCWMFPVTVLTNKFKKEKERLKIYHCGQWGNENLSISWKWLIVKFRTRIYLYNIYGVRLTFYCSRSFGIIRSTCVKMACNSKMAGLRAKRSWILDSAGEGYV